MSTFAFTLQNTRTMSQKLIFFLYLKYNPLWKRSDFNRIKRMILDIVIYHDSDVILNHMYRL